MPCHGHLAMFRDTFVLLGVGGCYRHLVSQDDAKYPIMHRTAPLSSPLQIFLLQVFIVLGFGNTGIDLEFLTHSLSASEIVMWK